MFLLCSALMIAACGPSQPTLEEIEALQAAGRWGETIEPLRAMIDAGNREPRVFLRYGAALSRTGAHSQALWPLQEAARDPEVFVPATMALASGAYQSGNHDLVIELLGGLLEREPEHLDALRLRCYSRLHTRRDYEGALEDSEVALDLDPGSAPMLSCRIVALLGLERVDDAREAIEEFAALEELEASEGEEATPIPDDVQALVCIGRAEFALEDGEAELAEERVNGCVDRHPANSLVVTEAIKFFSERADLARVDEILRTAYDAAPHDRSFRLALARREQLKGRTDEARRILEEGADAGYQGALIDLAGFLADQGDTEGAIEHYREARSQGASGARFMLAFGEVLIASEQYDEALDLAEGVGPDSHKAFIRGRVALAREQDELALEEFTRGVLLWPDNAVARYYTALAAEQVGDFDRAIEEYRSALRIDANAADARIRLARLHLAEGNPQASLYIIRYVGIDRQPIRGSLDAILVELEGLGWVGQLDRLPPELLAKVQYPAVWGRAVAALARGIAHREGDEGAVRFVESADRLDLTAPRSRDALRLLVEALGRLGRHEEAVAYASAAVEARSDAAEPQTLLGNALAGAGRWPDADAAYVRALEADPEDAAALVGRARVAAEQGRSNDVAPLLARAGDTEDEVAREQARLWLGLGKPAEARATLEGALRRNPTDGRSALALAELERSEGGSSDSVRELAERARRFGEGASASVLLAEPDGEGVGSS